MSELAVFARRSKYILALFVAGIMNIALLSSCPAQEKKPGIMIKADDFEGVIFPDGFRWFVPAKNSSAWTPEKNDIFLAESLVKDYLGHYKPDNEYYRECIPKILDALSRYKRQYAGFIDKDGEKNVFINFFIPSSHTFDWTRKMVFVCDGGYHYFRITVNLSRKQCFDLSINGVA